MTEMMEESLNLSLAMKTDIIGTYITTVEVKKADLEAVVIPSPAVWKKFPAERKSPMIPPAIQVAGGISFKA